MHFKPKPSNVAETFNLYVSNIDDTRLRAAVYLEQKIHTTLQGFCY